MNATYERRLRKATIGSTDHILAPDNPAKPDDALRHQFGMLDDIGGVADDTRQDQLVVPRWPKAEPNAGSGDADGRPRGLARVRECGEDR